MKKLIIFTLLCWGALGAAAQQTLHSSYFLKRMPQRHKLNPALINDYGYFSIPVLGNINIDFRSNLCIKDYLYPTADGNLMTFMHPDVSGKEFLKHIKDNNGLDFNVDYSILSFGFFGFKGYNTFDLSLRSNVGMYLPGDLFCFMKLGMDDEDGATYRLHNLIVKSNNYVELALGHAHKLDERLTIGAKVKFLAGAAGVYSRLDDVSITMREEQWEIRSNGFAELALAGATLEVDEKGEITGVDVDADRLGMAGWGLAFDLGATYQLLDNLTLSAGLVDLGFLRWNKNLRGETDSEPFVFDGFHEVDINNDDAIDDEVDRITEDFEDMAHFYAKNDAPARCSALQTTLNVGAEYSLLNDKISFGLLSSTRFSSPKVWTELMAAANLRPGKWFNFVVTGTVGNFGASWGWLLNICPRKINIFVGTDHMLTSFTPQYVPTQRLNFNLNFGLSIPMGGPLRQAKKAERKANRLERQSASQRIEVGI